MDGSVDLEDTGFAEEADTMSRTRLGSDLRFIKVGEPLTHDSS
jgi:hypothetical protein